MEIAAVYLQPIEMEPRGIDLAASLADIHLEADIHALKTIQMVFQKVLDALFNYSL